MHVYFLCASINDSTAHILTPPITIYLNFITYKRYTNIDLLVMYMQ